MQDLFEENLLTKVLTHKNTSIRNTLKTDEPQINEEKLVAQDNVKKTKNKKSKKNKKQDTIKDQSDKKIQSNKTKNTYQFNTTQELLKNHEPIKQLIPHEFKQIEQEMMLINEIESLLDEEISKDELFLTKTPSKDSSKPQIIRAQNTKTSTTLIENLIALESKNKKDKNGKEEKRQNKETKGGEKEVIEAKQSLSPQIEEKQIKFEDLIHQTQIRENEQQDFVETLNIGERKYKENAREQREQEESKDTKTQKQGMQLNQTKEVNRTQILYRSAIARDNMRHFAHTLREEILNYKPPITKLSMELNPANLGSLELTITKKGKDLHVQVVSNATAIGLFLQNQIDFRANLSQVGFENVDLNFTTSDQRGGTNHQEQNAQQNHAQSQKRNENSLDDLQESEMHIMNITLPKYA